MNIAIAGYGFVGKAIEAYLQKTEHTTQIIDPKYSNMSVLDTKCDGIIIGSPTRFGNMAAPLKFFIDNLSTLWVNNDLVGKPSGAFCSTASLHGGQEATLLSMMVPLLHLGTVIVSLPYKFHDLNHTQSGGTPYGPSHWSDHNNNKDLNEKLF